MGVDVEEIDQVSRKRVTHLGVGALSQVVLQCLPMQPALVLLLLYETQYTYDTTVTLGKQRSDDHGIQVFVMAAKEGWP